MHASTAAIVVWCLVLHAAAAPVLRAASSTTSSSPAAAGAVCRLHLEGFGDRPGLRKAQLACTGGLITAAAHPQLLELLGSAVQGVRWSTDTTCQELISGCLLAICDGTAVTLVNPTVTSIVAASKEGGNSVCITDGSRVSLTAHFRMGWVCGH